MGLLILGLVGSAGPVFAEELRADHPYAGGTRVEASALGIAFTIPTGWIGKFGQNAATQVLVMGSKTIEGVGLAILGSGQTVAELMATLGETQDLGAGVTLRPSEPPTLQESRIRARYQNDAYVGVALAVLGPGQRHGIFFFAGPPKNERVYAELVRDLAASTSFVPPATAGALDAPAAGAPGSAWSTLLSGMMLHYFSSYNSGGSAGGISAHRVLHLCSDGRFSYNGDSLVTMNVPGAGGSSGGRRSFTGRWSLESATQTGVVLVLAVDGGGQIRWPVQYDGQKTFVNRQRWLRAASDACR